MGFTATLTLLSLCTSAFVVVAAAPIQVFVDPRGGDDAAPPPAAGGSATRSTALRTVHAAAARVRSILAQSAGPVDVTMNLLPGVHHVGGGPLRLGPADAGKGTVVWRSADPSDPAVLGAPIRVTGWKPHPTIKNAFSAPLPSNVSRGSPLRQLWVSGQKAERPVLFGTGRQPGDNRDGHCLNLTNVSATDMYPNGAAFDFTAESATDPSTWTNPGDVELAC